MTERLHFHCHALEKEMATQARTLENPRDWGVWWAVVCGVAQSRTRLRQLSSSNSSVGLRCCAQALSSCGEDRPFSTVVLVAEHGLWGA